MTCRAGIDTLVFCSKSNSGAVGGSHGGRQPNTDILLVTLESHNLKILALSWKSDCKKYWTMYLSLLMQRESFWKRIYAEKSIDHCSNRMFTFGVSCRRLMCRHGQPSCGSSWICMMFIDTVGHSASTWLSVGFWNNVCYEFMCVQLFEAS